jgi:hypothetical protein
VAAAFWLIVGGARVAIGEEFEWFVPHVTLRTLVVSYCLGVVMTFVTVVLSSVRISRLNIVAAVRGLEEATRRREGRQKTRWLWVALGIPALVIPPLGLYWLLRKASACPGPGSGPIGLVSGVLLILLGVQTEQSFPSRSVSRCCRSPRRCWRPITACPAALPGRLSACVGSTG